MLERLLTKVFKLEQISGNGRCPVYLYRWTLFQPQKLKKFLRGFGIYLHKFVGDDWSLDFHDHPKRFISIGLKGKYIEWTPLSHIFEPSYGDDLRCGVMTGGFYSVAFDPDYCRLPAEDHRKFQIFRAPWIRTFPAHHMHRLELLEDRKPCWTLVVVLTNQREWGFWPGGKFVWWRDYVKPDNPQADSARSCV